MHIPVLGNSPPCGLLISSPTPPQSVPVHRIPSSSPPPLACECVQSPLQRHSRPVWEEGGGEGGGERGGRWEGEGREVGGDRGGEESRGKGGTLSQLRMYVTGPNSPCKISRQTANVLYKEGPLGSDSLQTWYHGRMSCDYPHPHHTPKNSRISDAVYLVVFPSTYQFKLSIQHHIPFIHLRRGGRERGVRGRRG